MKFVPFDVMHTQIFNHEIIFDLSNCLLMSNHTVFILNDIFDKNSHFMLTQILKPTFLLTEVLILVVMLGVHIQ